MRARTRIALACAALALFAAGALVGTSLGGTAPQTYSEDGIVTPQMRPATAAEAAGAPARAAGAGTARQEVRVFSTRNPVTTEPDGGTITKLTCPRRFKAISGGIVNNFRDLVMAASTPINPANGRYSPRNWFVAARHIGPTTTPLTWQPVIVCLNRVT